jgi:hypothetical protein
LTLLLYILKEWPNTAKLYALGDKWMIKIGIIWPGYGTFNVMVG